MKPLAIPLALLLLAAFSTRALPAQAQQTYTWNGGSGNWSTPGNWTPSGVPGPTDTARIDAAGTYTVTLDVNAEVGALELGQPSGTGTQTLSAENRTLTIHGASEVAGTGKLTLRNVTLNGPGALTNAGQIDLLSGTVDAPLTNVSPGFIVLTFSSAFNGPFSNEAGATLQIGNGGWPLTLTVADGFTNEGQITFYGGHGGGTAYYASTLIISSGTLVNEGTIMSTGVAHTDYQNQLRAALDNRGTLVLDARGLRVEGAGLTYTFVGAVTVAADKELLLNDGAFTFAAGGETSGEGTVIVQDDPNGVGRPTATFEAGAALSAPLVVSNGTLRADGALTPASFTASHGGNTLSFGLDEPASGGGGRVAAPGPAQVGGTLALRLLDGYVPEVGDAFTVVSGSSLTGTFGTVEAPPNVDVEVAYDATSVTVTVTGVTVGSEPAPGLPAAPALHAAYPNPFGGRAAVGYDVAAAGRVRVAVYDALGREVAVLADGERAAGRYEAILDGRGLAAGVYVVRMTAGAEAFTRRVTLAR